MAKYRDNLPQMEKRLFLTDGGLETTLVFHENIDLPDFAAFTLLDSDGGKKTLESYFDPYLALARQHSAGLILDTCTWRANPDWGARLGYDQQALDRINQEAVAMLKPIRERHEIPASPMPLNGCIGPRGDGYIADTAMTPAQARDYHLPQVRSFAAADADMVSAITMTSADEATGIVQAAESAGMPVAVAFTVETDGRLPSGESLADAIAKTDARTGAYASYFMINCAHPTHFDHVLASDGDWRQRIHGLRANASAMSHAELDEATELDSGDPDDLASRYASFCKSLPNLNVFGGCCGTDHRHLAAIAEACRPQFF